jgi:hypothetical protein
MGSPFTTAAVGIGVGEGGKGVLVGRIGDGVVLLPGPIPLHPLIKIVIDNRTRRIVLVFVFDIICVDYNASRLFKKGF